MNTISLLGFNDDHSWPAQWAKLAAPELTKYIKILAARSGSWPENSAPVGEQLQLRIGHRQLICGKYKGEVSPDDCIQR